MEKRGQALEKRVQVTPLKGDQNSEAQGFNPGLGNSKRCALKGHQKPVRHIGSKSLARASLHPPSLRYGATFSRFADAP
jgi:hypothetical protein